MNRHLKNPVGLQKQMIGEAEFRVQCVKGKTIKY